ncbi:hypothetical protein AYO38_02040 [bacterium SCGC AG-212-C10]|nr:hypothetical protein AYO38_02040 [bacterium SCGC AG-212-C10]
MTSKRVLVVGLPFFGTRTAESLRGVGYDAHYLPHPGRDPAMLPQLATEILMADVVYTIGSSVRRNSPLDLIARTGKAMLVHWVGTDVSVALDDYRDGAVSDRVIRRGLHRADSRWLVEELQGLGVRAQERLLPIPVAIGSPEPLPETFRVLVYLPAEPQEDYDVKGTLEVIRALPDVQFMIVGGFRTTEQFTNVEVVGFVHDMPAVYRRATVLLRLMKHDGMSHSVIEAASFARYVVWTYAIDGVLASADAGEAAATLRELHEQFLAGTLDPNNGGAEHMRMQYRHERVLAQICRDLDRLLT